MHNIICDDSRIAEKFCAYQGDCVSILKQLPDEIIDFSVYSPPFGGNLFVYGPSAADMGNCTDEQFIAHYSYLVKEKFRLTKPGRLTAVHCSDLPMTKWKDGHVGIKDFSGQIIDIHCSGEVQRIQDAIASMKLKAQRHYDDGDMSASARCADLAELLRQELMSAAVADGSWVLHSRRTIWKCPVVEMTRTKHVGLLYKQLMSDSAKSRGGMPDYLLTFVKPGENADPIRHTPGEFPLDQWQEWASPVWMTVNQTNVLNVKVARSANDERHLCPLQLDVIDRALVMWSNPGDVVLSPFMGIGSEGYCSLKAGRKFIGTELKEAYFRQAVENLRGATAQTSLFGAAA